MTEENLWNTLEEAAWGGRPGQREGGRAFSVGRD